ncbi:MAG: putative bifunctional diguanylate cyclase/phosphodiesterase, partial [Ilumatobacter sp.]
KKKRFPIHAVAIAHIAVLLDPAYFWLAVVALAALVAGHSVPLPRSTYFRLAVLVPILVFVVGLIVDAEYVERAAGLVAVLGLSFGALGEEVQNSLDATKDDLRFAIDAAGGIAHVTDLATGPVRLSGDVKRVVGWSYHDWMTMDRIRVVHPDDRDNFRVDPATLSHGQIIERIGRVRTEDGRWIWLHDTSRVVDRGDRVELHGFTVDVTAQQIGLGRVTAEAKTDPLTGLANRRALNAELERLEATARHHLVLIDLNRFKEVNDTFGHEAGDSMLRVVADRILESMQGIGLVARLGGDEFALVYRHSIDTSVVSRRLLALAERLSQPMGIGGVNVTTSISAGIVQAEPGAADRSTMMRHADMAMYIAKHRHLTSVVFDRLMGDELERRSLLSTQVPAALAAGEIVLHFQPIVDAADHRIAAVEGLARWEHPVLGTLTPAAFLDSILLSDRAGDFTRATVEAAAVAATTLAVRGSPIAVAVNVPVRAIEDPEFENWFTAMCARTGARPEQLVFEVAERDLHDENSTGHAIDRLSALGADISVDDFGTGYATFDRLRWRNVSQLKLDHGIVRDVATSDRDAVIVRHVIELAHALGNTVVGEGVETAEQLATLRTLGCELLQGYHFSRVVPFDDILEMLDGGGVLPVPAAHDAARV